MKLQIEAAARSDLVEGYQYYEDTEEGLGDYFLATLYSDIESLRIFGGIHSKAYKNLHRALSKKFPFAVYYTIEKESVVVRAVLDCRRDPSWIRRRIYNA
jgi:hypothetical protein